jgi:hypothetical protein
VSQTLEAIRDDVVEHGTLPPRRPSPEEVIVHQPSPATNLPWQSGLPIPGVAVDGARIVLEIDAFGTGGSEPGVTPGGAHWDTNAGDITITGGPGVDSLSFEPGARYAQRQPMLIGTFFPQRIAGMSTGYILLHVPTAFVFQAVPNPLHPVFKAAVLIQVKAQEPPPGWPSGRDLGTTCSDNEEWTVGDVSNQARPAGLGGDPVIYHEAFAPLATTTCVGGTIPASTASPSSLQFSTHILNRWSDPQTVTVTNTGQKCSVLQITSERFATSSRYASFEVERRTVGHSCLGSSLMRGQSCYVQVVFLARDYGEFSGSVTFTDNGGPETATFSGSAKPFSTSPPIKVKLSEDEKKDFKSGEHIAIGFGIVYGFAGAAFSVACPICALVMAAAVAFEGIQALEFDVYADDPPDMHFHSVAVPATVALPRSLGLTGPAAPAATALFKNMDSFRAISYALLTSINRAQGAELAHDSAAQEMQVQAAQRYALGAATLLAAQPALLGRMQTALVKKGVPAALSAAQSEVRHSALHPERVPCLDDNRVQKSGRQHKRYQDDCQHDRLAQGPHLPVCRTEVAGGARRERSTGAAWLCIVEVLIGRPYRLLPARSTVLCSVASLNTRLCTGRPVIDIDS